MILSGPNRSLGTRTTATRRAGWLCASSCLEVYDLEIADADSDESEIRELYAINDKFYELALAALEGDQKRNLIRPDQPSSDEEADGP